MSVDTTEFFVLSTLDEALRQRIVEMKPALLADADSTGTAKTAVTVNGMAVGNVVAAFKDGPKVTDPEAFEEWQSETLERVEEWDVDFAGLYLDALSAHRSDPAGPPRRDGEGPAVGREDDRLPADDTFQVHRLAARLPGAEVHEAHDPCEIRAGQQLTADGGAREVGRR